MRTADLAGKFLHGWVSAALGQPPGTAYSKEWPAFDALLEREAIHLAPMPGKAYQWCAIVVGRIGGRLPEGRGRWMEGPNPRIAVARAIVSARYGAEVPDEAVS
jgi:hypothetical protein